MASQNQIYAIKGQMPTLVSCVSRVDLFLNLDPVVFILLFICVDVFYLLLYLTHSSIVKFFLLFIFRFLVYNKTTKHQDIIL